MAARIVAARIKPPEIVVTAIRSPLSLVGWQSNPCATLHFWAGGRQASDSQNYPSEVGVGKRLASGTRLPAAGSFYTKFSRPQNRSRSSPTSLGHVGWMRGASCEEQYRACASHARDLDQNFLPRLAVHQQCALLLFECALLLFECALLLFECALLLLS